MGAGAVWKKPDPSANTCARVGRHDRRLLRVARYGAVIGSSSTVIV